MRIPMGIKCWGEGEGDGDGAYLAIGQLPEVYRGWRGELVI